MRRCILKTRGARGEKPSRFSENVSVIFRRLRSANGDGWGWLGRVAARRSIRL